MCQLVNRENDREALKTILKCIQLLKDDKVSVGIFPEGYIHEDHKLYHFRHGVLKVAQKAKVPIVVCTMKDTHHVIPDALKGKGANVELSLLAVIPAEEVAQANTVELGERIYEMMAAELGPDRVHQESEAENT
jgi:1-acyl-sn-glycerol-3-phosphate acyltransferase